MPRRLLFQAACDFLEALCAHGNKRAQQKLFPYISSILDHMGVQALDVAQVVRDLPSSSSFWRALVLACAVRALFTVARLLQDAPRNHLMPFRDRRDAPHDLDSHNQTQFDPGECFSR